MEGVTEKGPSEVLPISDIKSLEWVTNRNYRKKRALDIRDCDFEPFAERNRTLVIRTNPKQYLDGTHVIVFHMLHPEETYAEAHDISWAHYEFTRVVVGASKNAEEPYLLIAVFNTYLAQHGGISVIIAFEKLKQLVGLVRLYNGQAWSMTTLVLLNWKTFLIGSHFGQLLELVVKILLLSTFTAHTHGMG
ncbi:hypothetical protein BGW41_006424 [Actinomortierella wolfii]|nr:hypothetical protein BGW41_006424 [Actinomortierella wolfii]